MSGLRKISGHRKISALEHFARAQKRPPPFRRSFAAAGGGGVSERVAKRRPDVGQNAADAPQKRPKSAPKAPPNGAQKFVQVPYSHSPDPPLVAHLKYTGRVVKSRGYSEISYDRHTRVPPDQSSALQVFVEEASKLK